MQNDTLIQEKESYRLLCQSLYEEGVIKQSENGDIVPVEDAGEREQIRTESKRKSHATSAQKVDLSSAMEEQIEPTTIFDPMNHPLLDRSQDKMEGLE